MLKDWSITVSILILLIFLIRVVLDKHLRKTYQCILWGIVLIRLLIPNMPSSSVSIWNIIEKDWQIQKESVEIDKFEEYENNEIEEANIDPLMEYDDEQSILQNVPIKSQNIQKEQMEAHHTQFNRLYVIWLIGVVCMGAYFCYGYLKMRERIKRLMPIDERQTLELFERCKVKVKTIGNKKRIRLVEGSTAMIFGVFHPTIVMPTNGRMEEREAILLHELMHYKYKDYLMTYILLIALSLHWFNPLAWLAIRQMREDIELACDERVISLGVSKKSYATALFNMIVPSVQERLYVQGMGENAGQAKNRMLKIANMKQKKLWGTIASSILICSMLVGCLTDATSKETETMPSVSESKEITEDASIDGATQKETDQKQVALKNVVVLGMDRDGVRADSIFVVQMDDKSGECEVLSIPRDTKIILDETEKVYLESIKRDVIDQAKLGHLVAYAGEGGIKPVVLHALKRTVGLSIDHYVMVNIEEAERFVDALGGIEVRVPQDMNYDDNAQDLHIHLKAGKQHLDGEKTMQLIRFRRYPEGEIGRISATHMVIKELFEKAKTISTATQFIQIAESITKTIKTDIPLTDLPGYYSFMKNFASSDVRLMGLDGEAVVEAGASYFIPNGSEIQWVIDID